MPSPFQSAGAMGKPSSYAPIFTNRFFTGLWTNRSPLRDAATPYLYEKFYSGSRFESLFGGLNTELTSRLTLARRPGHSVYNSQLFPPINDFYDFRVSSTTAEIIKVIADTVGTVYDATGPSTKTALFTKSAGAGQTLFQRVGNVLYAGNGVDTFKWVQTLLAWSAAGSFTVGQFILDTLNNLQMVTGIFGTITAITISNGVLTVTVSNNFVAGASVTLTGLTTATFLNGVTLTIGSATATGFTASFSHAAYATAADTGTATASSGTGTAGSVIPTFSSTPGNTVNDGKLVWTCKGSSVQKFGTGTPSVAPSVANTAFPPPYPAWAANTFYSPGGLYIVDSNNNIQLLTTAGTTGTVQPTWNVTLGGTTADNAGGGTAVWTNQGPKGWPGAAQPVAAGTLIQIDYSVTVYVPSGDTGDGSGAGFTIGVGGGGGTTGRGTTYVPVTTNYSDFFKCTTPGTTGGAAPSWQPGIGTTVADGSVVVWTNVGPKVIWTTIGASTLVATAGQIIDSNGNLENVLTPGKSGAAHPTWTSAQGGVTTDANGLTWTNAGSGGGVSNTGAWKYAYSWRSTVTSHVSTASPPSAGIILAANSFVQVGGAGNPDLTYDVIRIWRTGQAGNTLLFLVDIPAPANGGAWTYNDTNTDTSLTAQIQAPIASSNNAPPVGFINLTYHLGRVFGSVGNVVFYSGGPDTLVGNGNEAFPPANNFVFPSRVTRLLPTAVGLLVFTVSDIYIISGQGNASSPLVDAPFLPGIGLSSYNALDKNGSTIYMMASDNQLLSLDPSAGISHIGHPIADKNNLGGFAPTNVYTAWHIQGDDMGLYVSDGSTGWYRMNPTPAPESGLTWSPKATIAAGVKAIESIEVSPGQRRLLMGPSSGTGPILQRDVTKNTDNGATFAANATVGSVVLAQAGQIAEVSFITVETVAVGSHTTVGILLGEISGNFETIPKTCDDPPQLPVSTTIFGDRHYLDESQNPSFCRHMQIQFSWPAEDAANELLTFTIFGAHHQEA